MIWKMVLGLIIAALPAGFLAAATPVGPTVPTEIIMEGNQLYIKTDIIPNPDNCASTVVILVSATSPAELERMYSALMTSLASGKPVTVWLSGCGSSTWSPSVPRAYHVTLHR